METIEKISKISKGELVFNILTWLRTLLTTTCLLHIHPAVIRVMMNSGPLSVVYVLLGRGLLTICV